MEINGISAIVTGGASGIGAASARACSPPRAPRSSSPTSTTSRGNALAAELGGDLLPRRRDQHRRGDRRGRDGEGDRSAAGRRELRRHRLRLARTIGARRQLRLGVPDGPLAQGHRREPHRHLQRHPHRGHGHEPQRAARGRRARRHREHGVGGRLRGPDRPGRLLREQGRHRGHDPPDRPRSRRRRHPGQRHGPRPHRHPDLRRRGEGSRSSRTV